MDDTHAILRHLNQLKGLGPSPFPPFFTSTVFLLTDGSPNQLSFVETSIFKMQAPIYKVLTDTSQDMPAGRIDTTW